MPDDNPAQPPADQNPEDRLKALQAELLKDEQELGARTKARDALKSDVDSLAKTVEEIKKASSAFGGGLAGLNEERNKMADYDATKAKMIDAALGDKKAQVVAKIDEVKGKIETQRQAVTTARTNATQTGTESEAAQTELEAKQGAYDSYKEIQKGLTDNIQKLNGFRSKIEKYDDPPEPASMFVYLQEMETVLTATKIPTQAEFDQTLNARWKELDAAKEQARNKKLAWEAAKAKLTAEQATLAAMEKSRVDDELKATDEFN
jgi:DNA repair exonuclease SbcCD ATPase subunit